MARRNPCTYLPRRLQIVASLTVFLLFAILFLGNTSPSSSPDDYINTVPYGPQLQSHAQHVVEHLPKIPDNVHIPQYLNPFHGPAHTPPPEQANSSSGEARWYTDFKWRNPFSSSVTLDEERAVLPPLQDRTPVYTYFESTSKDTQTKDAEHELLQIWRRAWWAQGFRPVVLGKPEAMNNPLYRSVQGMELQPEMEKEVMRWLAWGNMGTGVLCNWLAVPMAGHEEPLLQFLRRGEFPALTRYEGLENGVFVGSKSDIEAALKEAIASPAIHSVRSMAEAVSKDTFTVDASGSDAVAFYSTATITDKYKLIKDKLSPPKPPAPASPCSSP